MCVFKSVCFEKCVFFNKQQQQQQQQKAADRPTDLGTDAARAVGV